MSKETIKCTDENIKQIVLEEQKKGDLNHLDVSNVTDMSGLFEYSQFNGNISKWNVSRVKNMNRMFQHSRFNQDISNWDVSNVTNMSDIFYMAEWKEGPSRTNIDKWDLSSVDFTSLDIFQSFYYKYYDGNEWIKKEIPKEKARARAKDKRETRNIKVFVSVLYGAAWFKVAIIDGSSESGWGMGIIIFFFLSLKWMGVFDAMDRNDRRRRRENGIK